MEIDCTLELLNEIYKHHKEELADRINYELSKLVSNGKVVKNTTAGRKKVSEAVSEACKSLIYKYYYNKKEKQNE